LIGEFSREDKIYNTHDSTATGDRMITTIFSKPNFVKVQPVRNGFKLEEEVIKVVTNSGGATYKRSGAREKEHFFN
jgi:hypothetical protein